MRGHPMGRRGVPIQLGSLLPDALRRSEEERQDQARRKAEEAAQDADWTRSEGERALEAHPVTVTPRRGRQAILRSGELLEPQKRTARTGSGDGGHSPKDVGYYPHVFMHVGLPRRGRTEESVGRHLVHRYSDRLWRGGLVTVHMKAGSVLGKNNKPIDLLLPSAPFIRLVMERIATWVYKKGPEYPLGTSLGGWLREEFGIVAPNAATLRQLREEILRFLTMSFDLTRTEGGRERTRSIPILDERSRKEAVGGWTPGKHSNQDVWAPIIRISPQFADLIKTRAAPVLRSALSALRRSALASDLYRYLTVAQFGQWNDGAKVGKVYPWAEVDARFQGMGERTNNLHRSLAESLVLVGEVAWPEHGGEFRRGGLLLRPTQPHVRPSKLKDLPDPADPQRQRR